LGNGAEILVNAAVGEGKAGHRIVVGEFYRLLKDANLGDQIGEALEVIAPAVGLLGRAQQH
jgi:hypothetical protein